MTGSVLVAGALVSAAVLVPRAVHPSPSLRAVPGDRLARPARARPGLSTAGLARTAAAVVGVAVALLVGGLPGALLGVLSAVGVACLLPRFAPGSAQARQRLLRAQVPLAGDLLVAALVSGAPVMVAAGAVGRAVGGPLGDELTRAARAVELGASPREAWATLLMDPGTATLARPLARAGERGSPPTAALAAVARELRREADDRALAAAEVAAVRAVGPLGACFLPAFVLLGVVPLVVEMGRALLWAR